MQNVTKEKIDSRMADAIFSRNTLHSGPGQGRSEIYVHFMQICPNLQISA